MADKIDINSAPVKDLTQLPGVSKTMAYRIVNHRARHGLFTTWEELLEVREFPEDRLDALKERAVLGKPGGEDMTPPRHLGRRQLKVVAHKGKGQTHKLDTTRRPQRMHEDRRKRIA
jgi:helix-hairpin-helix protein